MRNRWIQHKQISWTIISAQHTHSHTQSPEWIWWYAQRCADETNSVHFDGVERVTVDSVLFHFVHSMCGLRVWVEEKTMRHILCVVKIYWTSWILNAIYFILILIEIYKDQVTWDSLVLRNVLVSALFFSSLIAICRFDILCPPFLMQQTAHLIFDRNYWDLEEWKKKSTTNNNQFEFLLNKDIMFR